MKIRSAFKFLAEDEEEEDQELMIKHERKSKPIRGKKKKKRKKSVPHGSYFRKRMTEYDELLKEAYEK